MRANDGSAIDSRLEKLLFVVAILPGFPLLIEQAEPWGKYVFIQYAYSVSVALWITFHARRTKNAFPASTRLLHALGVHLGFMALVFAGQYLWSYLISYVPDFLTSESSRHGMSLYTLVGLMLLLVPLLCETTLLESRRLKNELRYIRNRKRVVQ